MFCPFNLFLKCFASFIPNRVKKNEYDVIKNLTDQFSENDNKKQKQSTTDASA